MADVKEKRRIGLLPGIGLPTIIIGAFWILTLVVGVIKGLPIKMLIADTIRRVGMNGILVLAMVPSIQSGTGPNFALPLGVCCGLFALVLAIELNLMGIGWLIASILIATLIAIAIGYLYGLLLNAVKGSEMAIATYTGFSAVALMCLVWLMVPFHNPKMGWFIGTGLRDTIQLDGLNGSKVLNNFLAFDIAGINIPTGLLLFFALFCFLVWLFFRSKTGIAISASGINPQFAKASGLNTDKNRIIANILSTILAAIGIIVYSQSYGYAQLYQAPLNMAFAAIAAILIGGASAQRAKISHVIVGTILFQGLLTTALPVANEVFVGTDLSEVIRAILQNGIILYALTKLKGGGE